MKKRSPNGAGTVYLEAGRRWCSEAYINLPDGRRKRVRGRGDSPEEAVLERLAAMRRLLESNPEADRMTFRDLSERWFEARKPTWKPTTVASYRTALDLHILPELGEARIGLITGMDVQRVLNRVMRRSEGQHVSVANRCRRVMHAVFAQAVRWQLLKINPAAGLEAIVSPARERGWWTQEQAVAFLAAAKDSGYHDLFWLLLTTGLRVGEAVVLRWRDLDAGLVTVTRTFSQQAKGKIQNAPKSRRGVRSVPLPDALRLSLEARRGEPDELVFRSRVGVRHRGGALIYPSNLRKALIECAGRAGVPVIRVHDLRRTYASFLALAGYHPSVIQKLLGHASPDLAMRVYTSVAESTTAGAVIELGGQIGGSAHGRNEPPTVTMSLVGVVDDPHRQTN